MDVLVRTGLLVASTHTFFRGARACLCLRMCVHMCWRVCMWTHMCAYRVRRTPGGHTQADLNTNTKYDLSCNEEKKKYYYLFCFDSIEHRNQMNFKRRIKSATHWHVASHIWWMCLAAYDWPFAWKNRERKWNKDKKGDTECVWMCMCE